MTSSREQFEEWWISSKNNLWHSENGPTKARYFDIWQASRQCIEVGLPEVEDPANFFCEVYDTHKIQQAMTSAGIKIKGA